MELVLLYTIVRLKRRVETDLFLSQNVAARLSGCAAIEEIVRLKQSKSHELEQNKQLEALELQTAVM